MVTPLSPNQRAWRRFKRNRLGAWSLWIFVAMLVVSGLAEVLSNDKPLVASYEGALYFPMLNNPPEVQFGGAFRTPTD
ncbi:MAG: ABC transporter permease, partial [Rhizobacter sp.]